ncbi:chemotaxis protein CheW [Halorhodospira halophila]|uniref:CheW protein n=1 Tax=Halorhodospira halophila (strain DSM 244 / SL1) TaxID=349124 RepID=A1WU97_HALHL|nr:chemotaxis protein CheW [Halorhodospira halophila]ABM61259.1 CheW protein [Halorhodospira halophila SL1]MBK1730009.1 hypothetical protein [Halorhodospira halophila]
MSEEDPGKGLPDHQHALGEYLQALLDEVEDFVPEAEASPGGEQPPPEPEAAAAEAASSPGESAEREIPAAPEAARAPAPQAPAAQSRMAERPRLPQAPLPTVAPPETASEPQPEPDPPPAKTAAPAPPRTQAGAGAGGKEPPADPTPAWARPFFQALTLHVGALRLAVPLVKLHRVVPWEDPDEVEPTVGQPAWMHGLLDHRGRYVQVVDTAEVVLPEDRRPPLEERRAGRIIIVGDGHWGLACREVGAVLKLTPEQVQWRSAEGRRRWLAGTVREHLCALVDTDAFADMLEREGGVGGTLASPASRGQNNPAGSG